MLCVWAGIFRLYINLAGGVERSQGKRERPTNGNCMLMKNIIICHWTISVFGNDFFPSEIKLQDEMEEANSLWRNAKRYCTLYIVLYSRLSE